MTSNTVDTAILESANGERLRVVEHLQQYGDLFVNGLYLIVVGMAVVFLLHRFASRMIYAQVKNRRLVSVFFGFLYLFVMVFTVLLAMDKIGIDVANISRVAFLVMLLIAVIVYFLLPFLPRLPFALGQMVEINGVLGIVDSISNFHTMVRTLDGTMVFIPNPVVLSSKISNFHDTPTRRVELTLSVNNDSDLEKTFAVLVQLMRKDKRVLEEPSPPSVFVVNVTAAGVDLMALCWVKNDDWFSTRSDLWLNVVDAFLNDNQLALSLPQQEVFIAENVSDRKGEASDAD